MNLKLNWCSYEAAEYAVKNWHYSHAMPAGKLIKVGVYEDDKFIGAVIFGRGANNHLLMPYGLTVSQGCELVRVALKSHQAPVTRIVSIAIKLLKKANPGLRLIVSFADSRQGHIGSIYQGGNWVYVGSVHSTPEFLYKGRWMHQRNMHSLFGTITTIAKTLPQRDGGYRLRYLYPLDEAMKAKILPLAKKYPKKSSFTKTESTEIDESGSHVELSSSLA